MSGDDLLSWDDPGDEWDAWTPHDAEVYVEWVAWSAAVDREIELADAPEWEEVPA